MTIPRERLLLYLWLWAGWFACVLLGRHGHSGAALAVPMIGWALFLRTYRLMPEDVLKLLTLSAIGMGADVAAEKLHLILFTAGTETDFFPFWLFALWLLFAPVFVLLQKPLAPRLWLAAILGAALGPLCYQSGAFFNVLAFNGTAAFTAYAVFWGLFLPLGMLWMRKPAVTS